MYRSPSSIPAVLVVMVVVLAGVGRSLLLAGLIDGSAQRNAVVVALPYDVGVRGEREQAFDCFPASISNHVQRKTKQEQSAIYLILMFRPPSIRVQTFKTSSPLRTLKTAPQTSSLASAN